MAARPSGPKTKSKAKAGPKTKSKAKKRTVPRGTALIVLDAKGNTYYAPPGTFAQRSDASFAEAVRAFEKINRDKLKESGKSLVGFLIENTDAWRLFGGMDHATIVKPPGPPKR